MDTAQERQAAELEFVRSAYDPETEAWCLPNNNHDDTVTVVRRLSYHDSAFLLKVRLPQQYPNEERLMVDSCEVEHASDRIWYDAAYVLRSVCRQAAEEQTEESILYVWQVAEDWMTEELPKLLSEQSDVSSDTTIRHNDVDPTVWFGRNLIYSHHIIGKQKRSDMKALAKDLNVTGYVKIGWPGIIIIEGLQSNCQAFYDTIRKWAWQYLVQRGEMKHAARTSDELTAWRKFPSFLEVDSMSIVADHCRTVGLEDLFLTSMKGQVVLHDGAADHCDNIQYHGVLVHVDHMNDPKQYRKWLQRSCAALDIHLLIQQCFIGRPKILVALASTDRASLTILLKKWRSQKVDMDARGIPCLERCMTVLIEGHIVAFDASQWEADDIHTTSEKLLKLIENSTKTKEWVEAVQSVLQF